MSNSVSDIFSDIADAIRAIDGTQTSMTPMQMPQRILDACGVSATATTPSATLPSVLQAIANSIRTAGGSGTMTPSQMASIISQLGSQVNPNTVFHFANGTSSEVNIQGELSTTVLENMGLKSNYSTWISQPTSVEVGSNVTSIGHNAFYYCDALTSISLPDTVTSIGDRVFFDCDNFTTINIPSQMTNIGKETFKWCKVASITLPASISTLGQNLFASCNSLTSVTFQGKTTTQVQGMSNYSWGIRSGCVITCSNGTITI